jgi:AraC-like DNA-binding protein
MKQHFLEGAATERWGRSRHQAELDMIEALRFHMSYLRYNEVGDEWNTSGTPRCDGLHYIHLVCDGAALIRWRGGELRMQPGSAYWLPAHVPVHASALGRYCHYYIAFRCAWHALSDIFWDWPTPICLGPWAARDFASDWKKLPLTLGELWRTHIMLQRMFSESFQPLDQVIRRANSLHFRFQKMFDLINRATDARLRVSDMAKAEFMTTNAFSRLFHAHFGTGPKNYLNQRLNQEICQLLLGTELPIKSIAEKLHFTDEYYFNRFFHRMNNISPARYRRRFLSSTTTIEIGNDH